MDRRKQVKMEAEFVHPSQSPSGARLDFVSHKSLLNVSFPDLAYVFMFSCRILQLIRQHQVGNEGSLVKRSVSL